MSFGRGLSIPTWTRITTSCSNVCQKLDAFHDILPTRTQSVFCHNAWIHFHSNVISPFISIVSFHASYLSAFVTTEFFLIDLGGPSLYFIKDTYIQWLYYSKLNVLSGENDQRLYLKTRVFRCKLEIEPTSRQENDVLTLCLWPDKLPLQPRWRWLFWHLPWKKKKKHLLSKLYYFHDNLINFQTYSILKALQE